MTKKQKFERALVSSVGRMALEDLGCTPVGDDPTAFIERGGLQALEKEAIKTALITVRKYAHPLIVALRDSVDRKVPAADREVARRILGWDLNRIETTVDRVTPTPEIRREQTRERVRRFRERQRAAQPRSRKRRSK